MEKKLTADLNVVANSNLEIEYLNGDLNIIQKLDDEPNDVGGLTSAQLKAKFDEAGNTIKTYINDTLIPAILADDATEAAREAAEQERVTAEQGRTSAESTRVQDEQKRVSAENGRVEAEAQRAAAEQARADENTGIVARATAQANAAAESAESTSASAQTAQSAASSAGAAASTASSAAAAASGSASDAAGSAATAAEKATAASGSASDAAGSAAAAAQSAASVAGINKTAESWAVGGTGTRPGEDTDNAKYWAEQAQAVAGGDFATKTEAQGYVADHNQSATAHSDIREAVSEAGKAFVIAGTLAYDEGTDKYTISGVTVTEAEIQAAIAAGKEVKARLTFNDVMETYEFFLNIYDSNGYLFLARENGSDYQLYLHTDESGTLVADCSVIPYASAYYVDNSINSVYETLAPKAVSVTLTAAGWDSSTKTQTCTVSGVTASNIVIVAPSPDSQDAYTKAGVKCTAQAENSLTFTCKSVPTETLTVNIVIMNG